MRKVQLEAERDDNEVELHYRRGIIQGLDMAIAAMQEIQRGQKLEDARAKFSRGRTSDDHTGEPLDRMSDVTVVLTNTPMGEL